MGLIGRSTRRPGFGPMRGALNSKITASDTSPNFPKLNERRIDTTNYAQYIWDGSEWQLMSAIDQNAGGRIMFWIGTQAEYDALTPDANTLYFIT